MRYSTIAIKPELHEKIKELAKKNYQTISCYIEKLIEKEVKQEKIFDAVINFYKILELGEAKNIEISLREFEYFIVCELGYGFDFQFDDKGKGIQKDRIYYFHPAQGFSEKPLNNFLH